MKLIAYTVGSQAAFGYLDGETIRVCSGDMFAEPRETGDVLPLADVTIDIPCRPSKLIALWNNGRERQSYPLADMIFSPAQLVSMISQGVTLEAGDIIACGTSIGAGPIPKGSVVDVVIDGIGTLSNRFE